MKDNISAPIMPLKPIMPPKPKEPSKTWHNIEHFYFYDEIRKGILTVKNIIDKLPLNCSLDKTKIMISRDDYCGDQLEFYIEYENPTPMINKNYEKEMKKYKNNIKKYEVKFLKYELKMIKYDEEKKIFDKIMEQKRIEQLEKELSILRGMC